jgi:transcriptional regulator with XRE-family HTH domain
MHASMLVDALKRALKAKGITYAEVAQRIGMSEANVKRMFSQKNFTLHKLETVLHVTGLDLIEVAHSAYDDSKLISELSHRQEKEIIGDTKLTIMAVSTLNLLTLEQIIDRFIFTEAEAVKYLVRLDKIGFLKLLPNNRYKLLVSRHFRWRPDGPIQTYFRELAFRDYLDSQFDGEFEVLRLVNVMVSRHHIPALLEKTKQLASEIAQQGHEDAYVPFDDKRAISFLLSARPWMPKSFTALMRPEPDQRRSGKAKTG